MDFKTHPTFEAGKKENKNFEVSELVFEMSDVEKGKIDKIAIDITGANSHLIY